MTGRPKSAHSKAQEIDACITYPSWPKMASMQTHITFIDPTVVTDRHWEIANNLPTCEAFIAYCQARENGNSHIGAMHAAWDATNK